MEPFAPYSGKPELKARVLIKVAGKCTTDHISPAGPWLKYKGHLGNISNCTLIGAANADLENKVNQVMMLDSTSVGSVPEAARELQKNGIEWVVVGEHNYGEGSAREHAALQPRYLGCRAVIVKSFARIHEKNLLRVGMLPLTFKDEKDYDLIQGGQELTFKDMDKLEPGKPVIAVVNGKEIILNHKMNSEHIKWFYAGSALNAN